MYCRIIEWQHLSLSVLCTAAPHSPSIAGCMPRSDCLVCSDFAPILLELRPVCTRVPLFRYFRHPVNPGYFIIFTSVSPTLALFPNAQGVWIYDPPFFFGPEVRNTIIIGRIWWCSVLPSIWDQICTAFSLDDFVLCIAWHGGGGRVP